MIYTNGLIKFRPDFVWVPSEAQPADPLSRAAEEWMDDWKLSSIYFHKVLKWIDGLGLPRPEVDAFAARHNRMCERYFHCTGMTVFG